jgi:hypothetical protein
MRRKKHFSYLKAAALAVIIFSVAAFFVLRRERGANIAPMVEKHQAGYKAEDRAKLEKLIHEGTKND